MIRGRPPANRFADVELTCGASSDGPSVRSRCANPIAGSPKHASASPASCSAALATVSVAPDEPLRTKPTGPLPTLTGARTRIRVSLQSRGSTVATRGPPL